MSAQSIKYDKSYYRANKQAEDRIALSFYYRLATSFVKAGKVLDYGCGTGHLIKRFKKGYESWVYDISSYALDSVKVVAPNANICYSPESLKQNTFDLIVSLHVLEHLTNPLETLSLFFKILNDAGVLIYVVPNTSGIGHRIKKERWFGYHPSHVSLYPAEKWLSWTESAGFEILKTGTDGLWNVPYLPFVPLWIQKLIFYPLPAVQVATGCLILPANWGESLIVVAQKIKLKRNEYAEK
jgi:SAM-dependent methyltransferase